MHFLYDRKVMEGNPTEWIGSIGLIYASDYRFSTSGGSTTNRSSCLSIPLYDWIDVEECSTNNWLYNNYHWTLTSYYEIVFVVFDGGSVLPTGPSFTYDTHPVVYLTSNVKIVSGTGSMDDPFILQS